MYKIRIGFACCADDFKPASLDVSKPPGVLAIGSNNDVGVEFDTAGEGKPPITFQGNFVPSKDEGLDCVLIFDGSSFRLEQVAGHVKSLRQIRNPNESTHTIFTNQSTKDFFFHRCCTWIYAGSLSACRSQCK